MDSKKIMDCERTKIEKWSRFQLPNRWKTIGVLLCIALFVTAIVLKFTEFEVGWFKGVLRRGILIGLLIISISKDKIGLETTNNSSNPLRINCQKTINMATA